jgi:hypothetical protein
LVPGLLLSGVTDDIPDKVSIQRVTLSSGPAMFVESTMYLITVEVLIAGLFVAGYDHHFLLAFRVFG